MIEKMRKVKNKTGKIIVIMDGGERLSVGDGDGLLAFALFVCIRAHGLNGASAICSDVLSMIVSGTEPNGMKL